MTHQLHHGDCLEVLRSMPDCSVDSIVTDPPYGLSFMGKKWDYDVPSVDVWVECLRVLKPGGHLLAFAGTRTQHRMAVRIEDAGFEIRDMIAWVYGSGFPKSLNLKDEWQGWGTALKPALEPITVARKPLIGTVAENVLQHGTGAINVDGGRVGTRTENESGWSKTGSKASENRSMRGSNYEREAKCEAGLGRWPANFIHDGSEEATDLLKDSARFFYCAKASKADRDAGLDGSHSKQMDESRKQGNPGGDNPRNRGVQERTNFHPTVKPTDLMRYLCRLVTPPNGIVLDPFNGSGSTGCAAVLEGFQYIGIEREAEYIAISEKRIQNALERKNQVPPKLF